MTSSEHRVAAARAGLTAWNTPEADAYLVADTIHGWADELPNGHEDLCAGLLEVATTLLRLRETETGTPPDQTMDMVDRLPAWSVTHRLPSLGD